MVQEKQADLTLPENTNSNLFFSNVATDYAKHRPSYPAAAIA
ncbi:MAG TPA: hypothetical protein V6D03_08460 [Candidatus Caenarcaniphilales bacterium]